MRYPYRAKPYAGAAVLFASVGRTITWIGGAFQAELRSVALPEITGSETTSILCFRGMWRTWWKRFDRSLAMRTARGEQSSIGVRNARGQDDIALEAGADAS